MRKMLIIESAVLAVCALAAILALGMLQPRLWLYPAVRGATQAKLNYETREMLVRETAHFRIKYTARDEANVAMVAEAAEKAYGPVTTALGFAPGGKQLIIIYPDRSQLNQAFGWSGDQSAMGVYWGGAIQVLSPEAWLNQASAEEFIRCGPMVHEYTHLVFDHVTNGNYPRWFTEGLAQYAEYRINGYEWRTATNSLGDRMYTQAELDRDFDALPDQSLAYRESLAAVRYIAEVHGESGLQAVIAGLKAGRRMEAAVKAATGLDYAGYEAAWRSWAAEHMAADD